MFLLEKSFSIGEFALTRFPWQRICFVKGIVGTVYRINIVIRKVINEIRL